MRLRRISLLASSDESEGPISSQEKLSMVCWLAAVAVAWGIVRSSLNSGGVNGISGQVPEVISIGFFVLLALPALLAFRSTDHLSWLLGASATVGALPQVPLMPFAREGVHTVLLALALTVVIRNVALHERVFDFTSLRLYWGFIGVCGFSILYAQLFGSAGIWELKVGVAEIILYVAFGLAVAGLCRAEKQCGGVPSLILDGLAWSLLAQLAIMTTAIFLSITTPLVRGNDSLWGLGFWDRIKSTFAGPDNAGLLFACSIPLMIYWGQRQVKRFSLLAASAYMQMVPWLIMASGSRGARIGMLVVLCVCLANRKLRPWIIQAFPSFMAASYVGFFYQSFPSAMQDLFLPTAESGMNLQGRFFDDKSRLMLLRESWDFYLAAPLANKLIGFGLGVGGFLFADYPSPHNAFDLVIETGLLGFVLMIGFVFAICYQLSRISQPTLVEDDAIAHSMAFPMFVALVVIVMSSAIYELPTWGFVMAILAIAMVLIERCGQGRCVPMPRSGG